MKFQITMEFPDGILPAIRKTPGEFADEMRLFAAAKYYELGFVSQEKAAEIADMSREDFLLAISAMGVTPFQYSAEEVIEEVEAWKTE